MTTANERNILETAHANPKARIASERGRKPGQAAEQVPAVVNAQTVQQAVAAADVMATAQAAYGQERDLLNQLLGQAQMAGAFSDFSALVRTSKLAYVKENKLYQQLKGAATPHGAEKLAGTWEEFCKLLGRSVDMVDRDIANMKAFGEEALESMSRMGIGYRDLRQYRRLPEDSKAALIEAAKAGDKGEFLDLAEEMIARHAKEKEAMAQALVAKDKVLAENATKINEQAEELEQARQSLRASAVRQKALWQEISDAANKAYMGMNATLGAAGAALTGSDIQSGEVPEALQQHARNAITFLAQQLADMAQTWGVQIDLAERIEAPWKQEFDPEDLAALAARNNADGVWQGR